VTTLTNAHPPLPSIYLALWWKASGFFPEVTREAVLMVASLGLLAVWRLAMRLMGVPLVAFWTVVLTGCIQSGLRRVRWPMRIFLRRLFVVGLVYVLPERDRKPWAAALWFAAAALSKETAICIPLTLAAMDGLEAVRSLPQARKKLLVERRGC